METPDPMLCKERETNNGKTSIISTFLQYHKYVFLFDSKFVIQTHSSVSHLFSILVVFCFEEHLNVNKS